MRYMFLIYSRETAMVGMSATDMDELKAAHWAVMDETLAKGIFQGAEPLHPTATATTVRLEGGKPLVLDGPFAEAREVVGGIFLLTCETRAEAVAIARECPAAAWASIEVRELGPCFH